MASTYLTKTLTASNRKTFTVSCWVKRTKITSQQTIFSTGNGNTGPLNFFGFNATDAITYWEYSDGSTGLFDLQGAAALRDTLAWYHIVLSVDTTQSTASNRVKFYVNGDLVTSFDSTYNTYPNQNQDLAFNQADQHAVGRYEYNNSSLFDGCISHFHFIDGTAYPASTFGSTDATTGEWIINTSPSVTYGTNGFFILKDGNGVTDQSGNSNNFTVGGGTLTTLQDNPSNNFCTMNILDNYYFDGTFSNVSNTVQSGNSSYTYCSSTFHVSSGKYYWEIKADAPDSSMRVGIGSKLSTATSDNLGNDTDGEAVIYPSGATKVNNVDNPNSWSGTSWTTNDILGFALDLDNNKLYISKNGTFMNSGNPTSGSTGTGALSITAAASTPTGAYFVAWGDNNSSSNATMSHNFGNGVFGTTAISSEGTNASGLGKFEYDVPAGYTALCTKGLNE